MPKMCLRLGLPDLAWGVNIAPSDLAGFKGPTSEGRGGHQGSTGEVGGGRKRKEGGGKGKERERGIPVLLFPHFESWYRLYKHASLSV